MRRRPGRLDHHFARRLVDRLVDRLGPAALAAVALAACSGGDRGTSGSGSGSSAGSAGSAGSTGSASASAAAAAAAEPDGPTGELIHALDRKTSQGFGRGDLAVGGGWIYWIERSRGGDAVVRRKPAARPAAEPELVAGPARLGAIAADADRLYLAGDELAARPHTGAAHALAPIAAGAWLEIVPGDRHLLVRSRDQVALVAKSGGAVETVWTGKHGKLSVDVDGDRFIAIPVSPWAQRSAARAITVYTPGAPPAVLAELPEARGDLSVDGGWIYFGGRAAPDAPGPPLGRIPRGAPPRAPERVGDPAWGFGELVVRKGVLYGMVFTGAWKLAKLALTPGARPAVLDGRAPRDLQALATDDAHVYYLTDFELKRAPR